MKRKFVVTAFSACCLLLQSAQAQITNPAPYCGGDFDGGSTPKVRYISNVTLGTLNNTSGNTPQAAPHYVFYNNLAAISLVKGQTYPLSIAHSFNMATANPLHFVAVYIDYNRDNDFDDAGERILQQHITDPMTNPSTASITIPATAAMGTTRMRVIVFEDDNYTWVLGNVLPQACTQYSGGNTMDWGETEDYTVTITDGTTTPAPTVSVPVASNITGTSAKLTCIAKANAGTANISFQYGTTISYGTVSAVTAVPDNNTEVSVTLTGLTPNTTYNVRTRGVNASDSAFSSNTTFTTSGGTGIDELDGQNGLVIYPQPAGDLLRISTADGEKLPVKLHASVYDMTGRLIKEQQVEGNAIPTGHLANGTYLLKLTDGSGRQVYHVSRIVISH
jgi:hypothetical protein